MPSFPRAFFNLYLLVLLFFANTCFASYKYDLSVCAIFQNEAPYLQEWIEFHRLVGVQHFYLCNNASDDNYQEILDPYIKKGEVELFHNSTKVIDRAIFTHQVQCHFYNECIERAKGVSKWVAFLDSDEFLVPMRSNSLVKALKAYDHYAGVGVNWRMFGTSNIKKIAPDKLLIEELIRSNHPLHVHNLHVKSIVKPEWVLFFENPHYAIYAFGLSTVNTDKIPFAGPFSPYIQMDTFKIHHYWLRDEDYCKHYKMLRVTEAKQPISQEDFEAFLECWQHCNEYEDLTMFRFVAELRKRLKKVMQF